MSRMNIGNNVTTGFVNFVADGRFTLGTGSYVKKGTTEKVYKDSISVFADEKFPKDAFPKKGDYVKVSGDLVISPRRDKPEEMQATYNVRFANQVEKIDAPKARESGESAGTPSDEGVGDDV